ncbi:MAG: ABC transporter substrate-binding protein [Burkholderiaceae bacterium]
MIRSVLFIASLFTIVTTSYAQSVSVMDFRGQAVHFDQTPERIVTLLPSLTEFVCALGACAKIVGTDRHSDWPDSILALPKLGVLGDTSVEAIVDLRPDVVLVTPSSRMAGRLESLGLKVLVLQAENSAQVRAQLTLLGRVLRQSGRADQLWREIQREIAQASESVPASVKGLRVYFEVAPAPYAAGAGSFIGEQLARLGLRNIASVDLGPFPRLNPEFIVRSQPDIIMSVAHELKRLPRRPGWADLAALRRNQVCGFESSVYQWMVRPGPRMGQAALTIANCLARLPQSVAPSS